MWVDIDNDDYLDLYIARGKKVEHLTSQLFRNLKDGTFQDISVAAFGNRQPAYSAQGCWGDYDNDGFIDLYENHFDSTDNKLWHNEGNLTFTDRSSIAVTTGWQATGAVWADFDTDGYVDLLVHTQAGSGTFTEKNIGGKQFRKVDLLQNDGQGHLLLTSDINLDGSPDFYMGNINSPDQFFISTDSGYIHFDDSMINLNRDIGSAMTAAFADINNDGYPDLLYVQNDRFFLFLNENGIQFNNITAVSGLNLNASIYKSSYIQDIDNDGYLDIVLFESSGRTTIWYGGPNGFKPDILPFPRQSELESVLSWTDYDNDGFIDLLVVTPTFTNLWHNDGNANRWLNVKLTGHKANSQGIGARVIAYSEGKVQYREIGYTQSTLGYSPLIAHFGFGAVNCAYSSPAIDSLIVIWEPGGRQVIKNVRFNELAVIDQNIGIVRTIEKPISISYGYANPYFLGVQSVYADTSVTIPLAVKIPKSLVGQSVIADEITFGIEYNSDIIDISPSKVAPRYIPPNGWTYKSSEMSKDSLFITITGSGVFPITDSLSLGSLRFDTYSAMVKGTYIFLDELVIREKGNEYRFCNNFQSDYLGEVLIVDRPVNGVYTNPALLWPLTVLPNPSSGNFINIRYSVGQGISVSRAEISVLDVLGAEVYHYIGEGHSELVGIENFTIPTTSLRNGTYIVRLTSSGNIVTGKFTVIH